MRRESTKGGQLSPTSKRGDSDFQIVRLPHFPLQSRITLHITLHITLGIASSPRRRVRRLFCGTLFRMS